MDNLGIWPCGSEVVLGCLPCHALQARDDKLLELVSRVVVDLGAFAQVLNADGDVGHHLGSG